MRDYREPYCNHKDRLATWGGYYADVHRHIDSANRPVTGHLAIQRFEWYCLHQRDFAFWPENDHLATGIGVSLYGVTPQELTEPQFRSAYLLIFTYDL